MRYTTKAPKRRRWPRRLLTVVAISLVLVVVATYFVRRVYNHDLLPVGTGEVKTITITSGESLDTIAAKLSSEKLIRSNWAFKLYVSTKQVRSNLEAGTYSLSPSQSTPEIVSVLTHGKIATTLVTILPGQRLSQIQSALIADGFSASSVQSALSVTQYVSSYPKLLGDLPQGATLEGFLYPDSFQKDTTTTPEDIVNDSLTEMQNHLTSDITEGFSDDGLSVFQGITLASIVDQEVSTQSDRNQVAQVFLSRLKSDISLGSDVTAYYGALVAGQTPSVHYDSPYNTLLHTGLPPGPISNVDQSALEAVAHPASTSWLYFVTGDNGVTYFSQTLQEHDQQTAQYCHTLCAQ
ncbi:MAG TPA: endolytic transglycosylase MltG [Candidatus Saccharimonadales bacterium]